MELEAEKLNQENVNRPASGTYGEKVAQDRLKEALPESESAPPLLGGPNPQTQKPPPPQPGVVPAPKIDGPAGPPGFPAAVAKPTDFPNIPGSTPLTQGAPPQLPPDQQRLQVLDMLATSPSTSPTTKEWAQRVMRLLTER